MSQYLVHAGGAVATEHDKTYVVNAPSGTEEEAQQIASEMFAEEFECVGEVHTGKVIKRKGTPCLILFLLVAILLSFVGWKNGHSTVSIRPDMISMMYAVFIYSAYVVRIKGLKNVLESIREIVVCILVLMLLASLVQIFLGTNEFKILGKELFSFDSKMLLIVAILLSWLGVKFVSVISLGLVVVCALIKLSIVSEAMGIWGIVYVLSGFIGIILYLKTEPLVVAAWPFYRKSLNAQISYLKNDISEAGREGLEIKNRAGQYSRKIESTVSNLYKSKIEAQNQKKNLTEEENVPRPPEENKKSKKLHFKKKNSEGKV